MTDHFVYISPQIPSDFCSLFDWTFITNETLIHFSLVVYIICKKLRTISWLD